MISSSQKIAKVPCLTACPHAPHIDDDCWYLIICSTFWKEIIFSSRTKLWKYRKLLTVSLTHDPGMVCKLESYSSMGDNRHLKSSPALDWFGWPLLKHCSHRRHRIRSRHHYHHDRNHPNLDHHHLHGRRTGTGCRHCLHFCPVSLLTPTFSTLFCLIWKQAPLRYDFFHSKSPCLIQGRCFS